jgi:hypothetical protein
MNAALKIVSDIAGSMMRQVREVNRKYAKPELQMTMFTKICLLALRVYLLAMIVLMGWFLIRQMRSLGHG